MCLPQLLLASGLRGFRYPALMSTQGRVRLEIRNHDRARCWPEQAPLRAQDERMCAPSGPRLLLTRVIRILRSRKLDFGLPNSRLWIPASSIASSANRIIPYIDHGLFAPIGLEDNWANKLRHSPHGGQVSAPLGESPALCANAEKGSSCGRTTPSRWWEFV
jgi:hypothetical protein